MRRVLTLLLLLLSAPALHAQAAPAAAAEQAPRLQQLADPLASPAAAGEDVAPAEPRRPVTEESAQAAEPMFDRNFWRSVLAGVIASVLTAVILRLIL